MGYVEQLRDLAERCGVATSYEGWDKTRREVSAETLRHILDALGVRAGSVDEVEQSLTDLELGPWRRTLPPAMVVIEGTEATVDVHVPAW